MTTSPFQVAAPPPPWKQSSCADHPGRALSRVTIYHAITGKPFLSFGAQPYPIEGGFSSLGGVPRSLIIDSCRILTGTYTDNVFICPKNNPSLSFEFDVLLGGGYICVVGSLSQSANYGVYTDFHTWNPPIRAQVPDYWFTPKFPKVEPPDLIHSWEIQAWPEQTDMGSVMSGVAKELDLQTCRLTLVRSATVEGCHVVPVEDENFYTTRNIHLQLLPDFPIPNLKGEQMVNDIRNFVTLGKTIRRLWDTHIMGFYPLSIASYVAYFFKADGNAELFHFKDLHLPDHTDPYLMYIRFALTVFHFRLASYDGDQPNDALPSCVKVFQRKASNPLPRDVLDDDVESIDDSGMDNGPSSNDGIPYFVFDSLMEEAQAKGVMLSEDLQAMVGNYYPEAEKTRINNVAIEYLRNHPAAGPMAADWRTV